ncbi:hypothetical protein YC2023_050349 [Brassica napus]
MHRRPLFAAVLAPPPPPPLLPVENGVILFVPWFIVSIFINQTRSHGFDQTGSIDPKLQGRTDRSILITMQNKKNVERILVDMIHFTRSAKVPTEDSHYFPRNSNTFHSIVRISNLPNSIPVRVFCYFGSGFSDRVRVRLQISGKLPTPNSDYA